MFLPESIRKYVEGQSLHPEHIGMSGAQVLYLEDMVLKIEPKTGESDNSLAMLRWLEGKVPVSRVIAEEVIEEKRYLLMSRVMGKMACDVTYLTRPEILVKQLADGLRLLWSVDAGDCPCDQTLDRKLANARHQVEMGLYDLDNVDPDTFGPGGFDSPAHLLSWLEENRPEEDPVLSHGDYCLPNVFFQDGAVSGFLDLGRCGICDRYNDIALCYRSLRDNFNGTHGYSDPGYRPELLFEELGLEPDWEKIRYYQLMDELF